MSFLSFVWQKKIFLFFFFFVELTGRPTVHQKAILYDTSTVVTLHGNQLCRPWLRDRRISNRQL